MCIVQWDKNYSAFENNEWATKRKKNTRWKLPDDETKKKKKIDSYHLYYSSLNGSPFFPSSSLQLQIRIRNRNTMQM